MSRPRLLMLDEPSLGLSPLLVQQVFETIRALHEAGMTVLLVEQNLLLALEVADRGYVIETGRVTLQGPSVELLANADVRRSYLGVEEYASPSSTGHRERDPVAPLDSAQAVDHLERSACDPPTSAASPSSIRASPNSNSWSRLKS